MAFHGRPNRPGHFRVMHRSVNANPAFPCHFLHDSKFTIRLLKMYPLSLFPQHRKSDTRNGHNPPKSHCYRIILYLVPLLVTTLILFATLKSWHPQHPFSHNSKTSSLTHAATPFPSCGSSPAEARSRGCHFDILSFAWQTPECFDAKLMDSFLAFGNWTFYAEPNRTAETVDLETALRGESSLFVDWKYHVTHCTFMWMQMHRAYAVRGYIDSHLDSYAHTMHCRWTLLERDTAPETVNVVANLKYPVCRKVGGEEWKGAVAKGFELEGFQGQEIHGEHQEHRGYRL
ncbi:hypothetical protein B0T16DRAFT_410690 [Cercophora newfieldiana]|uniref:Uncharacterized protein n=1 Tax=Cercophora newfieldiana TaxID=92897 RepID=A0AA39YBV1_9PEZI|nr:hypothetical protein B0T16DRAFT_410690 [Cercophora newfieldiana]